MQGFTISPIEFDKDRDDQMRVAAAVSNLRARNYSIPEVRCVCCVSYAVVVVVNILFGLIVTWVALKLLQYLCTALVRRVHCSELRKCLAAYDVRQCCIDLCFHQVSVG
jgi:hypothetical protein